MKMFFYKIMNQEKIVILYIKLNKVLYIWIYIDIYIIRIRNLKIKNRLDNNQEEM